MLRWLDPAGLLEQVQKTRFERGTTADFLRGEAALGLAAADPEEAAAIAETIADPAVSGGYAGQPGRRDAGRRPRPQARLARPRRAPGARPPGSRRTSSSRWVRWPSAGSSWARPEKARALFAEGRKLVETLPPQKRTDAGSFLAHLARVEPDACRWR